MRDLLMLIAVMAWAVVMFINGRFKVDQNASVAGIRKSPGLAMEFARSPQETTQLLGVASQEAGKTNRRVMARQQYLDFIYIPLYWLFFFFVLSAPMRQSASGTVRVLGWLAAALISVAALSDIFEDAGILKLLDPTYQGSFSPYGFAVVKWMLVFLVMGIVMSFPFLYASVHGTAAPNWITWPTSVALLGGSVLGLAGVALIVLRNDGKLFQGAELVLLIAFVLLLIFLAHVAWLQTCKEPGRSITPVNNPAAS